MSQRWRDKKRGTYYTEVGLAALQTAEPIPDGTALIVYRGDDGLLWARPSTEFKDGRFERVDVHQQEP